MPPKVYGEFSIQLEPHYHLIQTLPSDGNVFAGAWLTSEKLLSFTENEEEIRYRFNDIPFQEEVVTPAFSRAIPGTKINSYDLSVPVSARSGLQDIHMHLYDAENHNRSIKLEPELGAADVDDLKIEDNYPNRLPKSAKQIGREAVRNFLLWQLQSFGQDAGFFESATEQQLGTLIGQYHRGQRHTIRTARASLDDSRVLHAEKEEVFDRETASGAPVRTAHSVWLTSLLPEETLQLGGNIRARTVARLNPNELNSTSNSLSFEVEATVANEEDAEELTRQVIMVQKMRKTKTTQGFVAIIGQYLQKTRDTEL